MATAHYHSPQCVRGGHLPLKVREGRGVHGRGASGRNCDAQVGDSLGYRYAVVLLPIGTRVPSRVFCW